MNDADATLVQQLKRHATEHYEDGGWDVIVECWSDAQILEAVEGTKTYAEAVAALASIVDVYADRQADARNSAF